MERPTEDILQYTKNVQSVDTENWPRVNVYKAIIHAGDVNIHIMYVKK